MEEMMGLEAEAGVLQVTVLRGRSRASPGVPLLASTLPLVVQPWANHVGSLDLPVLIGQDKMPRIKPRPVKTEGH